MRVGLPLMKNLLTALAKGVLIPLRLTAAASATDATVQKKMYRSSMTAFDYIDNLNKEIKDIMKTVKLLEESGLLT